MITFRLILNSVVSPKLVFHKILDSNIKASIVLEAAIFIAIVNTLFTISSNYLTYSNSLNSDNFLMLYYEIVLRKPFLLVFIELLKIFFITVLITYLGKLFGGEGSFLNLFKCVTWVHFILIFLNVILFVFIQINIQLAGYLIFLTNFWIMWVLSECAAMVHKFKSSFLVFIVGVLFFVILIVLFLQIINSYNVNIIERVTLNV